MLQEDTIVRNDSKSGSEIPTNLRPISYASKTLSTTESNYSNIECEILGLLFAVTIQALHIWQISACYY